MGNCNFKTEATDKTSTLSINNFTFHYVIGRGGFGKVWKIEAKKTKAIYAMKEMSKARVISKKSVASVMNERQLLSVLKHPFIVNMIYAFQDRENLYLFMDLLSGGDLRYHLSKRKKFSEEETNFLIEFFVACMITGLEYIHSQGVLHRDIKPENLVFDPKGYLRITDFGIARVWRPDNSVDTSGTPGYMAPEVMCRQNHGVVVDYYAVGVIAYECMMGQRPYLGRNRKEIRDQILAKQVQLRRSDVPEGWSLEAADFINRLIQRKPVNRLGLDGPAQVKNHIWLNDFPWDKLERKELQPPFVPPEDELDKQQSKNNFEEENPEVVKQNALLLRRNSVQGLFNGYNYDGTIVESPQLNTHPNNVKKLNTHQNTINHTTAYQTTQSLSNSVDNHR